MFPSTASAQSYLEKFQQFMIWNSQLPSTPDPEFVAFISQTTPLSKKIRGRWLYQLALKKDWQGFLRYYQPSNDVSLQCYLQQARLAEGQEALALPEARALWLQNTTQPPSCNALFTWLLKNHDPHQTLIKERIQLALSNQNVSLATYLLKQFTPKNTLDEALLIGINQQPKRISSLTPGLLHGDFYLYGLKRLISNSNTMEDAIRFWQTGNSRHLLNEVQNQSFLNFLVTYKAMRNSDDTPRWFNKIKPQYYTDLMLDWEIRYALKHQQWPIVESLIAKSPQKEEPCWQYWRARALHAQGKTLEAKKLYEALAKTRHYYGFLASLRLKTTPNFANEPMEKHPQRLKIYQPITHEIATLYHTHQVLQASRLINDFASEIPKADKSALVQWLENDLQWHDKAMDLSNSDELVNQLSLRFPLAHHDDVTASSNHYAIPPELIYAVIRQESGFREDIISPAGAHGLMQIMPGTAKKVAKEQKINYRNKNQLFLSTQNINIGTAYLQQLAKRYNHHPILMAAAYNAGPTQVNYWLKTHPPTQVDIWIETLPWRETRNYLKNIIAFYAVYQYRMNQKSDLSWFMTKWPSK